MVIVAIALSFQGTKDEGSFLPLSFILHPSSFILQKGMSPTSYRRALEVRKRWSRNAS
jgi:hypothetical protein